MSLYSEVLNSPNFGYPKGRAGRNGHKIRAICLHISGASWQSNRSWIMNPAANASYNAIVRDDGSVVCLVPEENAAYAHGRINRASWPLLIAGVNPNLYTLSLARTGSNQNSWTEKQLESTIRTLRFWGEKYSIPLRRPHIFGHFEIDSVNRWYCPGRSFFDRVIEELRGLDGPAVPAVRYRIVAGSFLDEGKAKERAALLQEAGFEARVEICDERCQERG